VIRGERNSRNSGEEKRSLSKRRKKVVARYAANRSACEISGEENAAVSAAVAVSDDLKAQQECEWSAAAIADMGACRLRCCRVRCCLKCA
jgi:hypothetical protein